MAFPRYYSSCKIFPKFIGPLKPYFTGQLTRVIHIHLPVLVNIGASGFVLTLTRALMSDFRAVLFSNERRKDIRHSLVFTEAIVSVNLQDACKLSLCLKEKQLVHAQVHCVILTDTNFNS